MEVEVQPARFSTVGSDGRMEESLEEYAKRRTWERSDLVEGSAWGKWRIEGVNYDKVSKFWAEVIYIWLAIERVKGSICEHLRWLFIIKRIIWQHKGKDRHVGELMVVFAGETSSSSSWEWEITLSLIKSLEGEWRFEEIIRWNFYEYKKITCRYILTHAGVRRDQ